MPRQPSEGLQAYRDIAEELSGPNPLRLTDIDEQTLLAAYDYAKKSHKRWPPRPQTSGWVFTVISF